MPASIEERSPAVKERDTQGKTNRLRPLSRIEDLQPILDRDAWGFYLVLRIERIEQNLNLFDRLVFEPFFELSDSGAWEAAEISTHRDSSDLSFFYLIIRTNQSPRRLMSFPDHVEACANLDFNGLTMSPV